MHFPPSFQRTIPWTSSCWLKPQSCCLHAILRWGQTAQPWGCTQFSWYTSLLQPWFRWNGPNEKKIVNSNFYFPVTQEVFLRFSLSILITYLTVWWFSVVHLVYTNDELLYTKSESQQGVLTGLSVCRDTSFKLSSTSSNDQHSTVSLWCSFQVNKSCWKLHTHIIT